ncbi:hypothetical protein ACFE04_008118 [Oxalis oulophora]
MLEQFRINSVKMNNIKLERAMKWNTIITPRILQVLEDYKDETKNCKVLFRVKTGWEYHHYLEKSWVAQGKRGYRSLVRTDQAPSTKASKKGSRVTCKLCNTIGHNKRTCPNKDKVRQNVEGASDAQVDEPSRIKKQKLIIGLSKSNSTPEANWVTSPKKKRTPRCKIDGDNPMTLNEDGPMSKLIWTQIHYARLVSTIELCT